MGKSDEFHFERDVTLTWYGHESRLLDGSAIAAGDYLVGLREAGLRCNGISLVRAVLSAKHGKNWGEAKLDDRRLVELALWPSRIYAKALIDMTGGYNLERKLRARLHGAAHITGGGLPEKLFRRLLKPRGLGAVIDNPFEPGELIRYCQKIGDISDAEAYKTWNMGQGMVLVSLNLQDVIRVCQNHRIEAKVIGCVSNRPELIVHSKGLQGKALKFV